MANGAACEIGGARHRAHEFLSLRSALSHSLRHARHGFREQRRAQFGAQRLRGEGEKVAHRRQKLLVLHFRQVGSGGRWSQILQVGERGPRQAAHRASGVRPVVHDRLQRQNARLRRHLYAQVPLFKATQHLLSLQRSQLFPLEIGVASHHPVAETLPVPAQLLQNLRQIVHGSPGGALSKRGVQRVVFVVVGAQEPVHAPKVQIVVHSRRAERNAVDHGGDAVQHALQHEADRSHHFGQKLAHRSKTLQQHRHELHHHSRNERLEMRDELQNARHKRTNLIGFAAEHAHRLPHRVQKQHQRVQHEIRQPHTQQLRHVFQRVEKLTGSSRRGLEEISKGSEETRRPVERRRHDALHKVVHGFLGQPVGAEKLTLGSLIEQHEKTVENRVRLHLPLQREKEHFGNGFPHVVLHRQETRQQRRLRSKVALGVAQPVADVEGHGVRVARGERHGAVPQLPAHADVHLHTLFHHGVGGAEEILVAVDAAHVVSVLSQRHRSLVRLVDDADGHDVRLVVAARLHCQRSGALPELRRHHRSRLLHVQRSVVRQRQPSRQALPLSPAHPLLDLGVHVRLAPLVAIRQEALLELALAVRAVLRLHHQKLLRRAPVHLTRRQTVDERAHGVASLLLEIFKNGFYHLCAAPTSLLESVATPSRLSVTVGVRHLLVGEHDGARAPGVRLHRQRRVARAAGVGVGFAAQPLARVPALPRVVQSHHIINFQTGALVQRRLAYEPVLGAVVRQTVALELPLRPGKILPGTVGARSGKRHIEKVAVDDVVGGEKHSRRR